MPRRRINVGHCKNGCIRPQYCRGLCRRCYRNLHYEEHERDRRGAKKTPRIPIGGKYINRKTGYVFIKVAPRKFVLEHHLVMEKVIGRKLHPKETVHHRNGCHNDNRPKNLELWSSRHPKGQRIQDLVKFAHEILRIYESYHGLRKNDHGRH